MAKAPAFPFAPDEIVIALDSWAGWPDITVQKGARFRGDSPVVQRWPTWFVRDGTTETERVQAHQRAFPSREPHVDAPITTAPKILDDTELVICVKGLSANADGDAHLGPGILLAVGTRLSKDHEIVKRFRENFVPVVPPGRTRENSVRALSGWVETRRVDGEFIQETDPMLRMRNGEAKQFQRWFAGQYVDRALPEVRDYPHMFERL